MKFIAYYRVSTKKQGLSGLGLDAQKSLVETYVGCQPDASIIKTFTEVESGKKNDRTELNQALQYCELTNSTLIVSKLDRLSRDLHFLTSVMKAGIQFICADNPSATNLTLGILAVIAQDERERISERTKVALQAAKKRGVTLGNPRLHEVRNDDTSAARQQNITNANEFRHNLMTAINAIQAEGINSYSGIANQLNKMGIKSRLGKQFYPASVRAIIINHPGDAL